MDDTHERTTLVVVVIAAICISCWTNIKTIEPQICLIFNVCNIDSITNLPIAFDQLIMQMESHANLTEITTTSIDATNDDIIPGANGYFTLRSR
jgi:hypothetical protein